MTSTYAPPLYIQKCIRTIPPELCRQYQTSPITGLASLWGAVVMQRRSRLLEAVNQRITLRSRWFDSRRLNVVFSDNHIYSSDLMNILKCQTRTPVPIKTAGHTVFAPEQREIEHNQRVSRALLSHRRPGGDRNDEQVGVVVVVQFEWNILCISTLLVCSRNEFRC
jgi:hypothetical protein